MKQSTESDQTQEDWWYQEQLKGLYHIMEDNGGMIHTDYVKEKLKMIISRQGINFHPAIKEAVERKRMKVIESI